MKTLYLEAERRERKVVRLYEGKQLLAELVSSGDFLLAIERLLRKNRVNLKDIGEIEVAPEVVESASGRVALGIARALRYAFGL